MKSFVNKKCVFLLPAPVISAIYTYSTRFLLYIPLAIPLQVYLNMEKAFHTLLYDMHLTMPEFNGCKSE